MEKIIQAPLIILFSIVFLAQSAVGQDVADDKPLAVEAEVGIVSVNGNTRSESYLIRNITAYKFDDYLTQLNGTYYRNKARDDTDGTISAYEKWNISLRAQRDLNERLGIFLGQSVESDKEAGIDRRFNSDIGLKYIIARTTGYYTLAEFGYRYSQEEYNSLLDDEDKNLLRAYIESEKKWTPTFSSKLWVEYLPNLEDSDDYGLNGEASINAALNNIFSVKTAYFVKFDNQPSATYKTDSLFITSLVAKF